MESPKTIFLSYSWNDAGTAEQIDADLRSVGIDIKRDIRDLNYKDNIKDFMKRISDTDYVILLISKSYLQSPSCMYEVLELIKDPNYTKRILPIVESSSNIFNPSGKVEIIRFWDEKIKSINAEIKSIENMSEISSLQENIIHYNKIRYSIDDFIAVLSGSNHPSFEIIKSQAYKPILDFISFTGEDIEEQLLSIINIENNEEKYIAIDALLKKYPSHKRALFIKGYVILSKEEYTYGLTYYLELIKQYPGSHDLHYAIGLIYEKLNNIDKAIEHLQFSITINSAFFPSHTNLEIIYWEQFRDVSKAEYHFLEALGLDNNYSDGHYYYGKFIFEQWKELELQFLNGNAIMFHYTEALRCFPTFRFNAQRFSDIHYSLGYFLELLPSHLDKAIEHYNLCVLHNPQYFQAHCNLAAALRKAGDYELAQKHYELALDINPLDVISNNNMANLLWRNLGKYVLAGHYYKKAQKINPLYMPENYLEFVSKTGYTL